MKEIAYAPNLDRKHLPQQMSLKNENQRDWVHIVCDYYKDGNLSDYIAERACKMKEYEIA